MKIVFLLLLLSVSGKAEEWDAYNYPNPTTNQFQQCRMKTRGNICDPDGVLTESARYRLDHELKQLETRTRQENADTYCDKKGVTAAMAITRHVRGGSTDAVKQMANEMLRKWNLDQQCQKSIVIVVSTDDMKFWVARDDRVPVYAEEFTDIFMQQKKLFQQGEYQGALSNILHGTWEKALSKQGVPVGKPGGQQPVGPGFGSGGGGRPSSLGPGGSRSFKSPSIPGWVWLAIIFGVVPLLCCCLCFYLCCCKGKGGEGGGASQNDYHGGMSGNARPASGGGRSAFSSLITSMGGAGIGSLIGNMISGRSRGGGNGGEYPGGYNSGRGMGYNPNPVYDDNQGRGGHGLYPSATRKDDGGGGGWG